MGALLSIVSQAQTDTISYDTSEVYIQKNFYTYSSSLQFSMGQNLTVGDYGEGETPFSDAFATTYNDFQLSVHAKYSKRIKERYGFEVGAEFFRNVFNFRKFDEAYLQTTGDSMKSRRFTYEHFSIYGGVNYNFASKKVMLSASAGTGILYNFSMRGIKEGVQLDVIDFTPTNGRNEYQGGQMRFIRGVQPLFYAGLNLKYYMGDEFYFVANSHFTYSLMRIRVTENTSFRGVESDYLDKSISVNNISLSIGVGTLF